MGAGALAATVGIIGAETLFRWVGGAAAGGGVACAWVGWWWAGWGAGGGGVGWGGGPLPG